MFKSWTWETHLTKDYIWEKVIPYRQHIVICLGSAIFWGGCFFISIHLRILQNCEFCCLGHLSIWILGHYSNDQPLSSLLDPWQYSLLCTDYSLLYSCIIHTRWLFESRVIDVIIILLLCFSYQWYLGVIHWRSSDSKSPLASSSEYGSRSQQCCSGSLTQIQIRWVVLSCSPILREPFTR